MNIGAVVEQLFEDAVPKLLGELQLDQAIAVAVEVIGLDGGDAELCVVADGFGAAQSGEKLEQRFRRLLPEYL